MASLPGEEKSIGWKTATINSEIATGLARYFQVGKLVVLEIADFKLVKEVKHGDTLISGLPVSLSYGNLILKPFAVNNYNNIMRAYIGGNSEELVNWYSPIAVNNLMYYGTFIYLSK